MARKKPRRARLSKKDGTPERAPSTSSGRGPDTVAATGLLLLVTLLVALVLYTLEQVKDAMLQ